MTRPSTVRLKLERLVPGSAGPRWVLRLNTDSIEACATARARIKAREEAKLRRNGDHARSFNILTPRDLQFELWLDHLEAIGRHDLARQARMAGQIATSSKFPSVGMEGFLATGPFQIAEPESNDGLARVFSDGRQIR